MESKEPDSTELKAKKPASKKLKLGIVSALVLAGLVGGGYVGLKNMGLLNQNDGPDLNARINAIESKLNGQVSSLRAGLPQIISEEVRKVSKQEGFGSLSELQKNIITVEVINRLNIDEKISREITNRTQKITSNAASLARDELERDLPNLVTDIIKPMFEPYRIFNTSQVGYNDRVDSEILKLQKAISNLHTELKDRPKAIAIPEQSRQRLREFNILGEMADGVFSIQAPDRASGKSHYVTLYNGEPFNSKLGRHKVTGIEGSGKDAVLLIGSNYFIDQKREEYTPTQLAQFKKAKQKRKKVAQQPQAVAVASVEPSSTVEAMTTVEHIGNLPPEIVETQTAAVQMIEPSYAQNMEPTPSSGVQYLNGKILLPDWATVTKGPNLETALVVNLAKTEGERTYSIQKGKYYDFIGTVEEISPDGAICSATYCIGALR